MAFKMKGWSAFTKDDKQTETNPDKGNKNVTKLTNVEKATNIVRDVNKSIKEDDDYWKNPSLLDKGLNWVNKKLGGESWNPHD